MVVAVVGAVLFGLAPIASSMVPLTAHDSPAAAPAEATAAELRDPTGANTYTVRRGDYLYGIARRTGTDLATLLELNGLTLRSVIHPGRVLKVVGAGPSTTGATYTVVRGDCWSCIARKLGVPMRDLLAANGATVTTVIHPGQRLAVPARTTPGGWAGAPRPTASDPWLSARLDDAVGAWRVRLANTLGGQPIRVVWDDQLVAGADAVAEPTLTIRLHPRLQDRSMRTVLDILAHEFGHIMVILGVQSGAVADPGACHEKVADDIASRLRDRTVRVHPTARCTWEDARSIADTVIAQGF